MRGEAQNKDPVVMVKHQLSGETLWQLHEGYSYSWEFDGRLLRVWIPKGFLFDGASIPWFLRWIADRGRLGLKAPLVHDYMHSRHGVVAVDHWETVGDQGGGYWTIHTHQRWSRRDADRLFFRILREDGVEPRWLRRGAFKLVRLWSRLKGDKWT